jgi:chromosome segregation ATPase
MTLQELKSELDRRLVDIKEKVQELENFINERNIASTELKDARDKLRKLQRDIVREYNELGSLKEEDKKRFNQLEKNIFSNLETFNEAFMKAGSLVKQSKFASRDRSVDFKNPPGTK